MSQKEGDLNGKIKYHDGPSWPSGALSEMLFWPAGFLLTKSYRQQLVHQDMYKLKEDQSTEDVWRHFEPIWNAELKKENPSLIRAVVRAFGLDVLLCVLIFLCYAGLQFSTPLILPYMAVFFAIPIYPDWWGYVYMLGIWAPGACGIIFFNVCLYRAFRIGCRIRSALITLIYQKSMSITASALGSRGMVLNLMSTDAQIILDTFPQFLMGLISPIQLAVTIGLLSREIGVYCLIPIGILIVGFPVIAIAGKNIPIARLAIQRAADNRVKLTTEFISAIRIVKYYAWERPFLAKIDRAREDEIAKLKTIAVINAILLGALNILPTLAMGLTIIFYSINNGLGVAHTFAAISYLAYLRFPFVFLPLAITFGSQYVVSLGRIREFVLAPEIKVPPPDEDVNGEGGMEITNGTFTWDFSDNDHAHQHGTGENGNNEVSPVLVVAGQESAVPPPKLKNVAILKKINLKVPKGKLVIVVGGVGSGKSSLAMAFLRELKILKGSIFVSSDIAYCSQEPFIMNTTIRDNICFGKPYEPLWYQEVINACALVTDFGMFPAGDLTEVAEKGSNLSGGQRQRINVARALYSNRELYIFDDPFSAVDAHVGEFMFNNVIKTLREREKTVLLITNQLQFLTEADHIAVLKNGKIAEQGKFQQLMEAHGPMYELAHEFGLHAESSEEDLSNFKMSAELKNSQAVGKSGELKKSGESIKRSGTTPNSKLARSQGILKASGEISDSIGHEKEDVNLKTEELTKDELLARDDENRKKGVLIRREVTKTKAVAHAVYAFYFAAGGIFIYALGCIFSVFRVTANVGQSVWLSRWANPQTANQFPLHIHIGAYLGLVLGECLFIILFILLMISFTINTSRNIHKMMLYSIAHATTAFFDKTPLGRLLASFSKDMYLVDTILPLQLQQASNLAFLILAVIANLAIGSVYAIIIIAAVLIYYLIMLLLYRRTSIQAQRLESVSRAPIFTHFAETLEGVPTIRAYNMDEAFQIASRNKVDYNSVDFLSLRRLTQWFNMATSHVANLGIAFVFIMIVSFRNYSPATLTTALAVSALANSITLVTILSAFSFNFAEFEARMNSPERIVEYKNVPQEADYEIEDTKPPEEWPSKGAISFNDLYIAYKPGEPVLKGITASIKAKEKIGIVGRTGAGKSTLITALFRTTEPESGSVVVDDIDISTLGLFDLRSKLSIIPQVPQLFMGTVRYNLDPFGEHDDGELWKVLKMVSLDEYISAFDGKLDGIVEENGGNFSVGQRQLLSMARCLLRNTHILLLDEATASLDIESDALLQKMIRANFKHRTVLTIAHRLVTIIDSDRVMVLDAGKIVEFDSPKNLLKNKHGIFFSMVKATGPATAKHLKDVADGKVKVVDILEDEPDIMESSAIEQEEIDDIPRQKKPNKKRSGKGVEEEEPKKPKKGSKKSTDVTEEEDGKVERERGKKKKKPETPTSSTTSGDGTESEETDE